MKVIKAASHRNGICGDPFDVGIIEDARDTGVPKRMLVIQFDENDLTGNNCMTAVLDMDLLNDNVIEFGKNSWRGDNYHDEFKKKASRLFDKHTAKVFGITVKEARQLRKDDEAERTLEKEKR
tara:strand:- start:138 stop:506 length:369 start_codon:yes stop_codon:yes gene_type:complete